MLASEREIPRILTSYLVGPGTEQKYFTSLKIIACIGFADLSMAVELYI
jgi:hypothetical protein